MLKRLSTLPRSFAANTSYFPVCRELAKAGTNCVQDAPSPWRWGGRERYKHSFSSIASRWQQEPVQGRAEERDVEAPSPSPQADRLEWTRTLPNVCPGCGAHSQTVEPESAGFYSPKRARKAVQKESKTEENEVFEAALRRGALEEPIAAADSKEEQRHTSFAASTSVPICDRCHNLLYQSRGQSIAHPSMQSIQAIVEESPHKHNHIYHVLDAADFPMSLIPNLQHALDLPRLRTKNRRSKSIRYLKGRVAEVSFIITRSDLLAPKKEQVDTLMPYLQEVLREALGRTGRQVRLGNVRCVSAKRGWWTKTVKEEIWKRGGAGWMVGKVNVGKSALFEVVFPKGRAQQEDTAIDRPVEKDNDDEVSHAVPTSIGEHAPGEETDGIANARQHKLQETELQYHQDGDEQDDEPYDEDVDGSLLPPAQPETQYPSMPLVSSLPGTTASPIRIPFGNGKGELVDLPGVLRSSLDSHVKPEYQKTLVMKSRVVPEQQTIRPGQSLLLGGLIRISHKGGEDAPVILAYPFVPPAFEPHVTGNHKSIAIQTGIHSAESKGREGEAYTGTVSSIATEAAKQAMQSAGTFKLQADVTKRRSGPLTDPAAGKQKTANLPFVVYSVDILIESVGWIELVCQVRKRSDSLFTADALSSLGMDAGEQQLLPEVEVFSPEGKFVGARRPMNAWVLGGKRRPAARERHERPRQTISMQRRKEGGRRGRSLAG